MPIVDKKITDSEYIGNDISGLSNTPSSDGLSAVTLKMRFDALVKLVLIPKYNSFIDMLANITSGMSGARQIGYESTPRVPAITVYNAIEATNNRLDILAGGTIPAALNADVLVDGITNKAFLATERTSLSNKVTKPSLLVAKTTWVDTDLIVIEDGTDTKKMDVGVLKGLMGAYIAESGSNANGSYVKWSDGTMICTQRLFSISTGNKAWNFPQVFYSSPFVIPAIEEGTLIMLTAQIWSTSSTLCYFNCLNASSARVVSMVNLIAFGRWKA